MYVAWYHDWTDPVRSAATNPIIWCSHCVHKRDEAAGLDVRCVVPRLDRSGA